MKKWSQIHMRSTSITYHKASFSACFELFLGFMTYFFLSMTGIHLGSSATRHSGFIQTLVQILGGHEFGCSPKTLLQRPPLAKNRQRPRKGPQENQDAAVRVGGFHIRPKEWHGRNGDARRRGHVGEGGSGGEAPAAASSSHPQACFHAPRQACATPAVHLLARQGTAAHGCRNCYWWVLYISLND